MLFQSWEYLLLLSSTLIFMIFIPNNTIKKIAILVSSMLFYAYGGKWQTLLFVLVIAIAYISGLILAKIKSKFIFAILLVCLFSPLFLYKYAPFILTEIFNVNSDLIGNSLSLPIGISFYSFQAASYVIDVYKRKTRVEHNFLNFACFISFFPQLVAGPIERAENLLFQIKELKKPSESDLSIGFRHIVLGLCLKLLIAETMAGFVNPIYNNLSNKGGLAVLLATFFFGIQIYCDFNGYSQIAIGSAKLMGINLMQNFNHPYSAQSISSFWRRWHISLTSWFTDYLYIPLGGNRKGNFQTGINTLVVFLVSGIWHGANWTFIVWGLMNGILIVVEKALKSKKQDSSHKLISFLNSAFTYIIINLLWVLFRSNSISDAFLAYKLIFTNTLSQLFSLNSIGAIINFLLRENDWSNALFLPLIASFIIYFLYEYGNIFNIDLTKGLNCNRRCIRWVIYFILILLTLYFGSTLAQGSFVYFRF